MSEPSKPLPRISAEARPYWAACLEGELRHQACRGCGKVQFYPRALCAGCGATDLEWRRSGGLGVVYAVTVVYRAPSEPFRADVPYAVALVDLDEGFRMMANVVGDDPEGVAIGDRVRVVFEMRGEVALPQFTRVEAGRRPAAQ
jgi:uncharacterized OB-fold protein